MGFRYPRPKGIHFGSSTYLDSGFRRATSAPRGAEAEGEAASWGAPWLPQHLGTAEAGSGAGPVTPHLQYLWPTAAGYLGCQESRKDLKI